MQAILNIRLYCSFVGINLTHYLSCPCATHKQTLKWIMHYIKDVQIDIKYQKCEGVETLHGFSHVDWVGDKDICHFTSVY